MRPVFGLLTASFISLAIIPNATAQVDRVADNLPDRAVARANALSLESGTGRVITLSTAAANIFVADPKVAEVRPGSSTSLFIFGVGPGRTTVAAMDTNGQVIGQYNVVVRASAFNAEQAQVAVSRLVQTGHFQVTPQPKGLLLTGTVDSPADAARALSIVKSFLAEGQTAENQLNVRAATQVNLRVRIIEMDRNVSRSLGVNWQAIGTYGAFATNYALPISGVGALTGLLAGGSKDANVFVDALAQDNLARILAEPNLTVMSGEQGSFLVGGEYPIPVAQQNQTTTIEFKQYGVALRFVPTVLSDGRINLHVAPEVSQISNQNEVQVSGGAATSTSTSSAASAASNLTVPSLTVRRAETTVELGSGQSFALAGLLQDNVTNNVTSVPLLGDLPIIGSLFRSTAFQQQQTELVILVTPYIVRPVNDQAALHAPGETYTVPNDVERLLKLRQVGRVHPVAAIRVPGDAGFIVQ
jgi:pilus assembly protein CpaC